MLDSRPAHERWPPPLAHLASGPATSAVGTWQVLGGYEHLWLAADSLEATSPPYRGHVFDGDGNRVKLNGSSNCVGRSPPSRPTRSDLSPPSRVRCLRRYPLDFANLFGNRTYTSDSESIPIYDTHHGLGPTPAVVAVQEARRGPQFAPDEPDARPPWTTLGPSNPVGAPPARGVGGRGAA